MSLALWFPAIAISPMGHRGDVLPQRWQQVMPRKMQQVTSEESHPNSTQSSANDHVSSPVRSKRTGCTSMVFTGLEHELLHKTQLCQLEINGPITCNMQIKKQDNKIFSNATSNEVSYGAPPPLRTPKAVKDTVFHFAQLQVQSSSKAVDTLLDVWPHLSACPAPGGARADVITPDFGNCLNGTPTSLGGISPRS